MKYYVFVLLAIVTLIFKTSPANAVSQCENVKKDTPKEVVCAYLSVSGELAKLNQNSNSDLINKVKAKYNRLLDHNIYFNGAAGTIDSEKMEYIVNFPGFPKDPQPIVPPATARNIVTNFVGDFVIHTVSRYRVVRLDVGSFRGKNRLIVAYDIQSKKDPSNWLPVSEHITVGRNAKQKWVIKRIDVVTDLANKQFP